MRSLSPSVARWFALVTFPALLARPARLGAQSVAAGVVARVVGRDTLPSADLPVVLHRVGADRQGPVDTVRTDRAGHFRFRFKTDTTASWLLSARYAGIEYFSQPVTANPSHADTAIVLLVADTSSTAPVSVRQRTLLVSRADESGSRLVLDWFVLVNAGPRTRVAPDTLAPVWGSLLPESAQAVELADSRLSQFAPEAVDFRGDSVLLRAPLSPGQKELMLQYRIPGTGRRFTVPVTPMDSLFVLLEDGADRILSPVMASADSQTIEGRSFRRRAAHLAAPGFLVMDLSGPALNTSQILALMVALMLIGFGIPAAILLRRRRPVPAPALSAAALADRIARLDAQYLGAREQTSPAEWTRYEADRAGLKAALTRALRPGT